MNILFLTIAKRSSQKMVKDIINEMIARGHNIYTVCPYDVNDFVTDYFIEIEGRHYLFVRGSYPVGKVGIVKKTINLLSVDYIFQKALLKAGEGLKFDMILYLTPPITLVNTIRWAKNRYHAKTILMLKDIFPQNAVDLGMVKKSGITGVVYKYFRRKEKSLYRVSDYIGCMSQANIDYVLKHNPEVDANRVGLCVNSYKLKPMRQVDNAVVREKYGLPLDKVIFLYGGNLGKPQGLQFLVNVMRANKDKDDRFFLICGGGNDQKRIEDYLAEEKPKNAYFMHSLLPDDFDELSLACDVGMILLDYRFTIPNFPSRLLSIMLNGKPVLAATDRNTDVGDVVVKNGFGYWCESTNFEPFNSYIDNLVKNKQLREKMGVRARKYFEENYTQINTCDQILEGYEKALLKQK